MGETKLVSPALLQRHLHKVDYPATRDELVEHARTECERVIATLSELPEREYRTPVDVNKAYGEITRKYVEDASYPASREQLVEHAKRKDASEPVIKALEDIPDRQYETPEQVSEAVAEEV